MQIVTKSEAMGLGLKKYFTGKPCKQGHISERYVSKSTCIECLKISSEKRKELKKEYDRKYYHSLSDERRRSERERLKIYARIKYWANPERSRASALSYQKKNSEKTKTILNNWKSKNKDQIIAYRQKPKVKDKAKFFASRRRAIKVKAMPSWANSDAIEKIYADCPHGMHVDHIVPLVSKFVCGLHCESNLRHLNAIENMSKNNHHWPDMWT